MRPQSYGETPGTALLVLTNSLHILHLIYQIWKVEDNINKMKPIIEIIDGLYSEKSFHYGALDLPAFEHFWHTHPEMELTFIQKGEGMRYVGDSIQPFTDGQGPKRGTRAACNGNYFGTGSRRGSDELNLLLPLV